MDLVPKNCEIKEETFIRDEFYQKKRKSLINL